MSWDSSRTGSPGARSTSRSGTEVRRRNFQVGVRLTEEEFAVLFCAAMREGISVAEYLRNAGIERNRRAAPMMWWIERLHDWLWQRKSAYWMDIKGYAQVPPRPPK